MNPLWGRALLGLGAVSIILAGATGAAACFPLPLLSVQPQASGAPGTEVTVEGIDFGDGPIEVRWNALDGPLLADGTGTAFSVSMTIPDAEEGVYAIVALTRMPDDSVGVKASTQFRVDTANNEPAEIPGDAETDQTAPSSAPTGRPTLTTVGFLIAGIIALIASGFTGALLSRRRRG